MSLKPRMRSIWCIYDFLLKPLNAVHDEFLCVLLRANNPLLLKNSRKFAPSSSRLASPNFLILLHIGSPLSSRLSKFPMCALLFYPSAIMCFFILQHPVYKILKVTLVLEFSGSGHRNEFQVK